MALAGVISSILLVSGVGVALCNPLGYNYGPPQKEETEVEVQKLEVYEVPWVGDKQPQTSYGPPKQQYGPPSPSYGPPPQEYDSPAEATTTKYSLTTMSSSVNSTNSTKNQSEKMKELNGEVSRGQYYIYHPNGLLQKVSYVTKDDSEKMAFSAQLKYANVDPVRGPIYTYDPETYVFSRLNRK